MESKKFQKLNKATIATVLAASGVTITAPVVPANAAVAFTDLNPQADYYEPVLELYNRGYIQGYGDGIFRPNASVTRGQAAKMLAQALGLNTDTPTDPKFTDVPATNNYYKYIAALAESGIISGYIDRTYRPSEPITRNQMAKIITLGYEFAQSTALTHEFNDVTDTNANKYYIQTLFDLGITKGTTAVTYSPAKPVTRGQLASFIIRAENATAESKKILEIGDITGNYVYINGIKYFIDVSLRSWFNEKNKAVLKGAHIEGQINGNVLKSIANLSIHASGTKNKLLVFDGNQTTFPGNVTITGNYLQFKNWNLTGHVTISEATVRSISTINPFIQKVASLNTFDFIDWTKPTIPDLEDDAGNIGDGTIAPKPESKNPIHERMPVSKKHIEFTNCNLARVTIEADGTHISADKKLPHVTVRGEVSRYEIYADIGTMYVETDVNTTFYGAGDIHKVYKNSYKNLYLNSDSHIGTLIIDSAHGWVDIGEFTYIDTVILPPGVMPNEVFNDFINDHDKIGNIVDTDGEDVDKDPIENTIIPDLDPPIILDLDGEVDGSDVTFEIRSNEEGEYYYMILKADERPPTIRDILANNKSGNLMEDIGDYYASFKEKLDERSTYVIYAVVVDPAGNVSDKASFEFETRDGTPPVIYNLTGEGLIGGTRAQVKFTPSEPGRYRYMILPSADRPPTLAQLLEQPETVVTANEVKNGVTFMHRGLQAQTQYTVYMMMTDESGNPSAKTDGEITVSQPFWTLALDNVPPRLTKTVLDNSDITDIQREPTKVVLTFSEALDKESAENVKNYTLGGTGNLKDNPYKATLSADGKKVTLLIPSMAAFVNNDTLTIRIRDVEDLAGNKIVDNLMTNFATYTYKSATSPALSNVRINETETNPVVADMPKDIATQFPTNADIDSNKVTFHANYTGTYYYLILPADPNTEMKLPHHYEIIFPKENYREDQVFQGNYTLASGWGEAVVGDGATLEQGNTFNIYYDPTKLTHQNGYFVYMVMRDRNGNYSGVEKQYFLPNKREWELINFEFDKAPNPQGQPTVQAQTEFYYEPNYMDVGNKDYRFNFNMRFNVEMDVATVRNKANYVLGEELAKFLEVKEVQMSDTDKFNAKLVLGYKAAIREQDMQVISDYVAYVLQDKEKLTVRMQGLKSWATSMQEAQNPGAPSTQDTATIETRTVTLVYKDQVKPRLIGLDPQSPIQSLAYRVNDNFKVIGTTVTSPSTIQVEQLNAELELTFSENVKVPTTASEMASLAFSLGSNVSIANVAYGKNEDGEILQNKLVVTLNNKMKDRERLVITLKDSPAGVVDQSAQANTVLINPNDISSYQAVYIYREMPMKFTYANLDRDQNTIAQRYSATLGRYVYESKGVVVSITGGYSYPGMKVHYLVSNALSSEITAEVIINADRTISDLFGTKDIENLNERIFFEAPATTNQIFNDDNQYINLVVTDSYGNVSNVISEKIVHPDPLVPTQPTP